MRDTLLLRADSVANDAWRWLRLDAEGTPQGSIHIGPLENAAGEGAGLRVVALVPGTECLLTRVRIPGNKRQKLLRAVPYALEDQLSDEVENLHFALGDRDGDGQWPVAVISRAYLESLLETLSGAGLDVQQVIPEVLAIPYNQGDYSVLVHNDIA
ncbi:MAG: type II secretion system protein GspL, partial [Gammaproteobacteria bacterium]|nr:type II secretion system protein GspL [Gammaproteobacteria bacterium]